MDGDLKGAAGVDLTAIEAFLYREADLLDANKLAEWIDLFTEDGDYWMPAAADQPDPLNPISLIFEDKVLMNIRMHNLTSPRAPSKDYPIRSVHTLANIRASAGEQAGEVVVTSNFIALVHYKTQTMFGGRYTHTLVPEGESFKIRRKRVDLIDCDAPRGLIITYV
ncbi:MAG: aromatic-ring-hydroxylating dioxygenase subunit beta [Pseudomonadota bacterium]